MEIIGNMKVYTAAELPEMDTSYFLPWSLDKLYELEPELRDIAVRTVEQRRKRFYDRIDAYVAAKHAAEKLVGWFARDPRLRSSGAWDCYFRPILEELRI